MNTIVELCEFPLCSRIIERQGFCFLHAPHFAGPKPEKEKKPIAKESKKAKKENPKYRKMVNEIAKVDDQCMVKSPVCTGTMQGMNHIQKRSPKNKMVPGNLTPCCNACNGFIENNTAWAKANGHLVSRFKKAS